MGRITWKPQHLSPAFQVTKTLYFTVAAKSSHGFCCCACLTDFVCRHPSLIHRPHRNRLYQSRPVPSQGNSHNSSYRFEGTCYVPAIIQTVFSNSHKILQRISPTLQISKPRYKYIKWCSPSHTANGYWDTNPNLMDHKTPIFYTVLPVSTCSSRDVEKGKSWSDYSKYLSPSFLFHYLLKIHFVCSFAICWILQSCLLLALGNVSHRFLQATDPSNDALCSAFYSLLRLCFGTLSVTYSCTFSHAVSKLVILKRATRSPTCGICDVPLG